MDDAKGDVKLESSPGRGTAFVLTFPLPASLTREETAGGGKKRLSGQFSISKQQSEIIALLKYGLLRKEISDRLSISINTLNTQIRRLFEKCRVNNKTELLNIFE